MKNYQEEKGMEKKNRKSGEKTTTPSTQKKRENPLKLQKNVCEIWQLLFYALMKALWLHNAVHTGKITLILFNNSAR